MTDEELTAQLEDRVPRDEAGAALPGRYVEVEGLLVGVTTWPPSWTVWRRHQCTLAHPGVVCREQGQARFQIGGECDTVAEAWSEAITQGVKVGL